MSDSVGGCEIAASRISILLECIEGQLPGDFPLLLAQAILLFGQNVELGLHLSEMIGTAFEMHQGCQ